MIGQRILVPLDGSPFAEHALPYAVGLAKNTGGVIHLLTVHVPVTAPDPPVEFVTGVDGFDAMARERWHAYLDQVAGRLAEATGIETQAALIPGPTAETIVRTCAERGCDLVVMATHGRGGAARLWLGSVTDRVARRSAVPVLLVRLTDDDIGPPDPAAVREPTHIVVPLDGSDLAETALPTAEAIARAFGIGLTLFQGVPEPIMIGSPYLEHDIHYDAELHERRRGEARAYLERIAAPRRERGLDVAIVVSTEPDVPGTLVRLADAAPGAIIAMTSHGRGGFQRLILGSVADKVVRRANRPVLLVPQATADDGH